jgi:thiamine biosynthesis protein ThiS
MQIVLNGESRSISPDMRLPALIDDLRLGDRRLAVELNGAIVPRSAWDATALSDGDRLEIVHAIGGG